MSAIVPARSGPVPIPMPNDIEDTAIVEPIPYFLPSSIINAEAAGMASPPLIPPRAHTISKGQNPLVKGIKPRKAMLITPPRIISPLRFTLSAILPPRGWSDDIIRILAASNTPINDGLKPRNKAAKMGKKVAKAPLPKAKANRKLNRALTMLLLLIVL